MDDDDTLRVETAPTTPRSPQATALQAPDLGIRYDLGPTLGQGGMGEVRLARDRRIDREVAVKLMRSVHRDEVTMARFFREAHVQGILDHPSVVPIHDLGVDPDGNPYIVMKRLTGTTLGDVLAEARPGRSRWSRPQLLARLVDVCLAIEFAHARGVIHRDLKPSNIMLGDFGETYVLDWGIARIVTARPSIIRIEDPPGADGGETATGAVLGTPGYMAPEQARGQLVEPSADVYALGCVLFEILVGKPALPRGVAAITMTLEAACHRPSQHTSDVPPELDDLCARATAGAPAKRPTARRLADGIQAYLDGDRDVARRRELASEIARRARDAFEGEGDAARASAMREAGRALALDPSNATAQDVLGRMLLEAPAAIPEEARRSADEERGRTRQKVLRSAGFGYLGIMGAILLLMLLPVRHLWLLGATAALALLTGVTALGMSRRVLPMRTPWFILLLALNCALIGMSGVLFTPLLVMPMFLIGSFSGWLQQPTTYHPWIVTAMHALPLGLLLGLEGAGVLPSTFHVEHHRLVFTPWVVDLTPAITFVVFGVTFAMQALNSLGVMLSTRYAQQAAQDAQHAHAWHLRQILPRV